MPAAAKRAEGAAKNGRLEVTMPQLGESVTEGQISRWLKRTGDTVAKHDALVEVITDKVNAEVPSPASGTMVEILIEEGETVAVGVRICVLATTTEIAHTGHESAPEPSATGDADQQLVEREESPVGALRASPAVRRLAADNDLDLRAVNGTGTNGRVTRRDVENHLAAGAISRPPTALVAPAEVPPAAPILAQHQAVAADPPRLQPPGGQNSIPPSIPVTTATGDHLIPLTPMRKSIAEHMVRSRRTSPHAWSSIEVDMTSVVQLRAAHRDQFRHREGVDLTFVPFVIKAAVEGLKRFPNVNATFSDEGLYRRTRVNISLAVSLDGGLIVPVIHDADQLSIAGLAHRVKDLSWRARAGQLKVGDIEGGTFCVNNPGTFGTVLSAPIINQPQVGIMTMEAIVKRPAVVGDNMIGIRSLMNMCMSFDHRAIDGMEAASFLGAVKLSLEGVDPTGGLP
jgi:2-oxoisovalerate dehydrogenase E2 component (dihydrolipoyl transacylase)